MGAGVGKQVLRTHKGLEHRRGRSGPHPQVSGLRRPFPCLSFQELSEHPSLFSPSQ